MRHRPTRNRTNEIAGLFALANLRNHSGRSELPQWIIVVNVRMLVKFFPDNLRLLRFCNRRHEFIAGRVVVLARVEDCVVTQSLQYLGKSNIETVEPVQVVSPRRLHVGQPKQVNPSLSHPPNSPRWLMSTCRQNFPVTQSTQTATIPSA